MPQLRVLTDEGITQFESYLVRLREDPKVVPPFELLTDPHASASIGKRINIEQRLFASRREAATYLLDALGGLDRAEIDHNSALWTWLGLLYFDQLCPADGNGARRVRSKHRYVLPRLEDPGHFQHYYRHLLAGAFTTMRLYQGAAKILLCGAIDKYDDFNEQLASRQKFITNSGLIEAVDLMYYDPSLRRPRRGAASNKRKPGTLRRLIDVVDQMDLTYDFYSMTGPQILGILPREFQGWAPKPVSLA